MSPLTDAFVTEFRMKTQQKWKVVKINPEIHGFQFQQGTRWLPGLSEPEINEYEAKLGGQFSDDLRRVFRHINGTDLPTLNVYGNSGEHHGTSVGVYSFPRDFAQIAGRIQDARDNWKEIEEILKEQGDFELKKNMILVPFYIHRYIVCGPDRASGPVLSIHGTDVIVYADNLHQYLESEFLRR